MYILASFVKDKVSIGLWIYLWAFYSVPLIYISVFVPVPCCLDDCGFVVEPEVRQVCSSNSILLYQDYLAIQGFLYFHTNAKGTFLAKMGTIKDRHGMVFEAEGIWKRWQEYTEELYSKDLQITTIV